MKGRVLIVAGSDSGGGAGIQADIKAVTAMGAFAATAITALTAQNTLGVHAVHPVPLDFIARQIAVEARDKQVHCVDAPMTCAQAGAEAGTLTLMCGGRADAIAAAEPVMHAYSRRIVHVGKAGTGQATKMVNQICIAGVIGGLAEALRLAQAEHLDLTRVFEAISGGAAQSWQMDNRWQTMAEDSFDFGFAVDWMRKDLGLALDEGRGLGLSLPTTALIDQFFADVQALGAGRQDTSALVRRLPRKGSV